jgi:hypothetical protein
MPTLSEMLHRLLWPQQRGRAARSVEWFGWIDLVLGNLILIVPDWMVALLGAPPLGPQGANYIRLVGLLVSGLGLLYIVSGRLNAQGFIFASLLDRPLVPGVMAILWSLKILPGPVALAFSLTDFGGFVWTLWAWRIDEHASSVPREPSLFTKLTARGFGFASGVVRNSRVFHPDGRVFLGRVRSLDPNDTRLARAAERLTGAVLLRIGMGLMKTGAPKWLAGKIPDAPSIACRFFTASTPDEVRLQRRAGEDLDLLCTGGGDRLWKLVLNLATGGRSFGLNPLDYFGNLYFAQVPYRIDSENLSVWIRLVPVTEPGHLTPHEGSRREQALTDAVSRHAVLRLEAQTVGGSRELFLPIAEVTFEREIQVDQEALHFDPLAGRGFVPYGFLTTLRRSVYPVSFQSRPSTVAERARREHEGFGKRLRRFLKLRPVYVPEGESAMSASDGMQSPTSRKSAWLRFAALVIAGIVILLVVYLALRFTRDQPVDYADDVAHFKHGSTGGERLTGIPYWFWVALPEMFPEYLPDKRPGRGYSSFGMIYENGQDPKYALPVGVSRRNVRGIDLVYLNCAVCHTGSVRDRPGAPARVIAAMPANTFDLGAWGNFLTAIPLSEKFTPERLMDQIQVMQDDSHRLVNKPDLINRLIFRYLAVYLARDRLLMLRDRLSFINKDTWGPGRVDTFNAPKALLNFPMDRADPKELMGNVDFPSVWYQGPRKGMQLHWDGNNTSVDERNLSAAFGTGAYPPTLDAPRVLRTAKWLETAKPPSYPYTIDSALAGQGAPIYQTYCAGCHGTRGSPFRHNPPQKEEHVGTVVPINEIGTDRSRLDSYTWLLAVNQSTLYAGYEKDWGFNDPYPQRFTHFRKTNGYANAPLDGIWLRAPYLHNGSVPNLRELLEPSAARTQKFYRGNDVYDPQNVGFVSDVSESGGRKLFPFDTRAPGNGNGGHEGAAYGTNLPPEQKRALLEYLKTF